MGKPMTIDELLEQKRTESTDIGEHLDTLKRYASMCKLVTEFGVRDGCSTAALLAGKPTRLTSYDIAPFADVQLYKQVAGNTTYFVFKQQDDCAAHIELTELLFIDTIHTYAQLDNELTLHANWVTRFIVMHDTYVKPSNASPENDGAGMRKAIRKLCSGGAWRVIEDYQNQNGLTVLERVS
jgi:hypothetical protein